MPKFRQELLCERQCVGADFFRVPLSTFQRLFFFFFFVELMSEVNNEIKDKSFLLTKLAEKIWKLCCPPFFEKFIPD